MRYNFLVLLLGLGLSAASQLPSRFDVIIEEILADPSPPVSLPNAEFIELKNKAGRAINLAGWRLASNTATSGLFPSYSLPPDSFLIITSTSNASLFAPFGRVMGIASFPALDNDGAILSLISKEGIVIHSVEYKKSWFANDLKKEGGWTLEMADTDFPCSGSSNWKESRHSNGGTPGSKNSVDENNPDDQPPQLKRSYSTDSVTLIAVFNEPVDSLVAADALHYQMDGFTITAAKPIPPLFSKVQLKLSHPMSKQTVYDLKITGIKDCAGNEAGVYNKAKAGLEETASNMQAVVNEILFNPLTAGSDYVEVFNRSKSIFNLNKIFIANRTGSGALGSMKKLSEDDYFFFPGDYMAITTDKDAVGRQYFLKYPDALVELSSLPSFPDEEGFVVLVNTNGEVIDEVNYSEKWHFPLVANPEGVSLERMLPGGSSSSGNFHSASATSGYGTPGYLNSQYQNEFLSGASVTCSSKTISPDNDGWQDYLVIHYKMDRPGFVANIQVFNAAGILVREVANNILLGVEGSITWDGLDEKKHRLPAGIYIVYVGLFSGEGKRLEFKNLVVVAYR